MSDNRGQTQRALFVLNQIIPSASDLENAAEAGAEILVDEAKRRAPTMTGKLKNSINKRLYKSSKNGASYLVFSSAFYADAVEKTPGRNKRPFMRPAFDSKQRDIAETMRGKLVKFDKVRYYK